MERLSLYCTLPIDLALPIIVMLCYVMLSHFSRVRLCVTPRRQPTRLPRPWDSPGKNTGVGCHFLLQYMKVKSEREVAQSCLTSRAHGLQPTRLLHAWDFPGKSTGVGCHHLLRVIGIVRSKTGVRALSILCTTWKGTSLPTSNKDGLSSCDMTKPSVGI